MDSPELRAVPRTVIGKQVKALRREGITPGVIYGHGVDAVAVQFDSRDLERVVGQAGTSTTVQVYVEGTTDPYLTIFRDVQIDPIRRHVVHIDLQALSLTETVRVPVTVLLTGESPAVEEQIGVLFQVLNELTIEALPNALVSHLEVDISQLTEVGHSISVGDITPPEGVAILTDPSETIVQIMHREAEEVEEAEEAEEVLEEGEAERAEEGTDDEA